MTVAIPSRSLGTSSGRAPEGASQFPPWRFLYPDDVEVMLVSDSAAPVTCAKGMRVILDTSWDELGEIDVLVCPGGLGTRADELLPLGRDIVARPDDRFVDNGAIITAAGVSAGIDMALHLVARLGSPEKARKVQRYIQYDPQPPW